MVFQSFNLVTRTTVIKNVLSACVPDMPFWRVLLGIVPQGGQDEGAWSPWTRWAFWTRPICRADQLSGGQQQRVALARTLTQSPQIILADEPVAALDPVTAKQVMQDFVHINQEMGISILLNIHHVELALEYADRIIGIRAGKIVYDGPSASRSIRRCSMPSTGSRPARRRAYEPLRPHLQASRLYAAADGTTVEEKRSRAAADPACADRADRPFRPHHGL